MYQECSLSLEGFYVFFSLQAMQLIIMNSYIFIVSGLILKCIYHSGLLNFCKLDKILVNSFELANQMMEAKETNLLPDTSPNSAPQPFIPLLAPSPMAAPFFHNSTPKLSGFFGLMYNWLDIDSKYCFVI